ncbi:unnamed protein product, partial [Bubo scandiacus]
MECLKGHHLDQRGVGDFWFGNGCGKVSVSSDRGIQARLVTQLQHMHVPTPRLSFAG